VDGHRGGGLIGGKNVSLLDKSSVKKSSVGRGCTIDKTSKVLNSVLMERVSIGKQFSISFFPSLFILFHTESFFSGG